MRSQTAMVATTQVEREAAAYNAFLAAVQRNAKGEASRLWKRFSEIHAQRPAGMVGEMEIAKGLR